MTGGRFAVALATDLERLSVQPVVRAFLLVGLLTGLSTEVFDRLWTARVVDDLGLRSWPGLSNSAIWLTRLPDVNTVGARGVGVRKRSGNRDLPTTQAAAESMIHRP